MIGGKSQELIPYKCKVEQHVPYNIMIRQILKRKCACGSKEFCQEYLEVASFEDGKSTTLRARSSGSFQQKLLEY